MLRILFIFLFSVRVFSIQVIPALKEDFIKKVKDGTYTHTVTLKNKEDKKLRFQFLSLPYDKILTKEEDLFNHWVNKFEYLILEPNETKKVDFIFKIPQNGSSFYFHYGFKLIKEKQKFLGISQTDMQILLLNNLDTMKKEIAITNKIDKKQIGISIKNVGNAYLRKLKCFAIIMKDQKFFKKIQLDSLEKTLLTSGKERMFSSNEILSKGNYKIMINVLDEHGFSKNETFNISL